MYFSPGASSEDETQLGPAAHTPAQRRMAERAKALARGLQAVLASEADGGPLPEATYLLAEARNPDRPLLERLRILGLMATGLDQFFVEHLPDWQRAAQRRPQMAARLDELPARLQPLLHQASQCLQAELLPALNQAYGVSLHDPATLPADEQAWLRRFFQQRVYPLLTPLAVDPGHPFPFISSFSLNLLVQLEGMAASSSWPYARIKVPRLIPRFVHLLLEPAHPAEPIHWTKSADVDLSKHTYVCSEELIRFMLPELFSGLEVKGAYLFRVLRAGESWQKRAELSNLRPNLRHQQLSSPVVRLDVEGSMPDHLLSWLVEHLNVPGYACYRLAGYLGQFQLIDLANLIDDIQSASPDLFV